MNDEDVAEGTTRKTSDVGVDFECFMNGEWVAVRMNPIHEHLHRVEERLKRIEAKIGIK